LLIEPPLKIGRARDTDATAGNDNRRRRWRFNFDAPSYRLSVEAQVNSERIAQPAWSACEFSDLIGTAPLFHHVDSSHWLNRPYEHRSRAFAFGCEIQAIVHPIDKINVYVRECLLHNRRLLRADYRVRSRVGGVSLSFNDPALARTDYQNSADEIARDFDRVASEEVRREVGHLRVSLSISAADCVERHKLTILTTVSPFRQFARTGFFLLPVLPAVL
jgi:hypothetical protein